VNGKARLSSQRGWVGGIDQYSERLLVIGSTDLVLGIVSALAELA
jgi:hypothetical protein